MISEKNDSHSNVAVSRLSTVNVMKLMCSKVQVISISSCLISLFVLLKGDDYRGGRGDYGRGGGGGGGRPSGPRVRHS